MTAVVDRRVIVMDHKKLNDQYYLLSFNAPDIARTINPGQFVNINLNAPDCFLRRPFSIYDVVGDTVVILYKVVGKGTAFLATVPVGHPLDVIGPLGHGYVLPEKKDTPVLLLGGGTGIASLHFLCHRMRTEGYSELTLAVGFQTKEYAFDHLAVQTGDSLCVYTDDGTLGRKGFVTASLETAADDAVVYACGPHGMFHAIKKCCEGTQREVYVSLEEKMACGIGACLGCMCETVEGKKTCCKDGPVFSLDDVVL